MTKLISILCASLLFTFSIATKDEPVPAPGDSFELYGKITLQDGIAGLKNLVNAILHKAQSTHRGLDTDATTTVVKERIGDIYYKYLQENLGQAKEILADAAEKVKAGSLELYERIPVEDLRSTSRQYYSKALEGLQYGVAAAKPVVSKWAESAENGISAGSSLLKKVAGKAYKKYSEEGLLAGAGLAVGSGVNKGLDGLRYAKENARPLALKGFGKARETLNWASHEVTEKVLPSAGALFRRTQAESAFMFAKIPWEQIQAYADTAKAEFNKLTSSQIKTHETRSLLSADQQTKIAEIAKNLYSRVPESAVLQNQLSDYAKSALGRAQEFYGQLPVDQAKNFYQSALQTLKQRATDVYVGLPTTEQAAAYCQQFVASAGAQSQVMYERVRIKSNSLWQRANQKLHGVKTYAFREITVEKAAALLEQLKHQSGDAAGLVKKTIYERVPLEQATEYVKARYGSFMTDQYPVFVRVASDALTKAQATATALKDSAVGLYRESDVGSLKNGVLAKVQGLWSQLPSLASLAEYAHRLPVASRFAPSQPAIEEGAETVDEEQ